MNELSVKLNSISKKVNLLLETHIKIQQINQNLESEIQRLHQIIEQHQQKINELEENDKVLRLAKGISAAPEERQQLHDK